MLLDQTAREPDGPDTAGVASGLTEFEREIVAYFVQVCTLLGLPKSVGEIYGLLYATPRPLTFADVVERLDISKGSASQGLRFLKNMGAVRDVYVAGDRRDHFEPVIELRKLLAGFIREKVEPSLGQTAGRTARLRDLAAGAGATHTEAEQTRLTERISKIDRWNRQARRFLPIAGRLID